MNEVKALVTLKLLKDFVLENNKNGLDRCFINGAFDIIERRLKALEVLNKKNVNIKLLKTLESLEEYNNMYADLRSTFPELTQDEYDLLKEC